jgi:hypothetical protein
MISDQKRRFDKLQERGFDALARRAGNTLVFNGRKVGVISSPIANEYVHEIVGFLPKRSASIEIKRTDFKKLGLTNESYVAINGVVLRVRQLPDDGSDISLKIYAHSTPDQGGGATIEDSGSVALAIGQVSVTLLFKNVNPAKPHVFTRLYIENKLDAPPILDLEITPGQVVGNGRRLELTGAPDTTNYVLYWEAVQQ